MEHGHVLEHLLLVLVASIPFALLLRRLGQSTIVGYLIGGLVLGPGGLGLIPHESISLLAEVGVGLLLFEVGIELSLGKLARMRRIALGGGALQVLATVAVGTFAVWAVGGDLVEGIYVGCAVSLSSTAIVLKTLADRGDLDAPHTGAATGVAIFQDLATVPMMVVLPALGAGGSAGAMFLAVGVALGKAALLLGVLWLGSPLVDRLLYQVARSRSPEIFVIAVLAVVIAAAVGSAAAGLSLALGAFLAGLLLSGSRYAHQILAETSPLKGVFQATFFVSIGMLIDPRWLFGNLGIVVLVVAGIVAGKAILAALALRAVGVSGRVAAATGLVLAQVGEFSFVLIALGRARGHLVEDHYQLMLAASFLSMAVAPPIIGGVRRIVDLLARVPGFGRALSGDPEPRLAGHSAALRDHLVICGFGLLGREVAGFAKAQGLPYAVLELNPRTVEEHSARGEPIFFGDFSNPRVLEHAGIERARALVVAAPDMDAARRAVRLARADNPKLFIVVRSRYQATEAALKAGGADEVVVEEFETALEMVARLGRAFGIPRFVAWEEMKVRYQQGADAGASK